jgi:hypothetical protein
LNVWAVVIAAPHLLRRLLSQCGDIACGDLRSLAAEARSNVVGDGRDLLVGIGVAERIEIASSGVDRTVPEITT